MCSYNHVLIYRCEADNSPMYLNVHACTHTKFSNKESGNKWRGFGHL